MLDKVFKIGLLILGILSLIELHNYAKNGRYTTVGEHFVVLDTRTGVLYDEDSGPQGSPGSLINNSIPTKYR